MILTRIEATGFRNLEGAAQFGPGLNIFYGDNAQGKTNWLEAIYVLGTTKSFRTSQVRDCLGFGAEQCIIRGETLRGSLTKQLQLLLTENTKELFVNTKRESVVRYLGNLDVFVIPAEGGQPSRLTFHSAGDQVLGWTPDGKRVLFSSNRGERFGAMLYTVDLTGGMPVSAGPDIGTAASYSPDGNRLAFNRKAQVYWRKGYRGSNQSDITVMDVAAGKFTDLTDFDGLDSWPMWSTDGFIYFVSDREGNGLTNIWRVPEAGGKADRD